MGATHSTTHSMGVFRFLDLPGELRNRVYELATTNTSMAIAPRRRYTAHPGEFPFYEDAPAPGIFALARASRQIRKEFLPILLRNVDIKIDLEFTDVYLDVFVQHQTKPVNAKLSITIKETHNINLLPLVATAAANPGLEIVFYAENAPFAQAHEVYRMKIVGVMLSNLILDFRCEAPWFGE
ncbi:hypothetical protein PMIN06_009936 [Paraphaeosphaeria minitans]